ncbi:MAG: hypothetical protein R2838_06135 [Caldilineaceae bacterium]
MRPALVIVDSIQAIYSEAGASAAGTVSQVRDSAAALMRVAKQLNVPVFLVGHVTKEGSIAGPRVLEHMVDAVLQLEGERFHAYRLLRSVKNRFGSTNEVGIFEMTERGMEEVRNPSELFLAERLPNARAAPSPSPWEGTRPLLVEVQALCSHTSFSQPRRTGNGVDLNRLMLLTAVLSKRGHEPVGPGHLRQHRGRAAHQRAGRGPVGGRGHGQQLSQPPGPRGPGHRGRSGPQRRTAQRGPVAAPSARSRQTRLHLLVPQHAQTQRQRCLPCGRGGPRRPHPLRSAGDRARECIKTLATDGHR